MVSEIVRVLVGRNSARVACKFVFKNDGKACVVRMCFPDDSSTHDNGEAPGSVFAFFRSSVDGRKARVVYSEHDNGWIKSVQFGRGQTHIVRDSYRVPHEFLDMVSKARTGFSYTLSTGGTWRGNIGRAVIRITFDKGSHPGRLRLIDAKTLGDLDRDLIREQQFWKRVPFAIALDGGPSKPRLEGRTLVYTRKNFKPTEKDDVHICFGPLMPAPWLKDR